MADPGRKTPFFHGNANPVEAGVELLVESVNQTKNPQDTHNCTHSDGGIAFLDFSEGEYGRLGPDRTLGKSQTPPFPCDTYKVPQRRQSMFHFGGGIHDSS
jgi:hypothetical protein